MFFLQTTAPKYLDNTRSYPRSFAPLGTLSSAHTVAHTAFESVTGNQGNEHTPHKTSILFMVFGQFIDHDVTATSHASTSSCNAEYVFLFVVISFPFILEFQFIFII